MTLELRLLAWSVVLGLVHLGAAATAKRAQEPRMWAAGPRDEPPPVYTGVAPRLARAESNFMETFPFFAVAVLTCHVLARDGALSAWGAQLYFWARVVYLPIYALGLPWLRTAVWLVSIVGLCVLLTACLA